LHCIAALRSNKKGQYGAKRPFCSQLKKVKITSIKGFKAVAFMRETRDQISLEIKDMSFAELQKYFEERRVKLT